MIEFIRRFRGLGVAVVVLALSAGAVFASSALPAGPVSAPQTAEQTSSDEPSEEPSETPESEQPSDAPETEAPSALDQTLTPDAATNDNHGALVSGAAKFDSSSLGFPNHGAFVSCVAHMGKDVLADGFDYNTVTPESCAPAPTSTDGATNDQGTLKSQAGKAKGAAGKAKGAAGKANGAAHRAAAGH